MPMLENRLRARKNRSLITKYHWCKLYFAVHTVCLQRRLHNPQCIVIENLLREFALVNDCRL